MLWYVMQRCRRQQGTISILFPSTLGIEASCSRAFILGDTRVWSNAEWGQIVGDQLKGMTDTSHESNSSWRHPREEKIFFCNEISESRCSEQTWVRISLQFVSIKTVRPKDWCFHGVIKHDISPLVSEDISRNFVTTHLPSTICWIRDAHVGHFSFTGMCRWRLRCELKRLWNERTLSLFQGLFPVSKTPLSVVQNILFINVSRLGLFRAIIHP